jgi:hypothetical protein
MKRKDIVTKLISEGISERTLSGMTDKQLEIMISRLLPEQVVTPGSKVMISKTSPTAQKDIDIAKKQKKTIETYEQELKGTEPKKDTSTKDATIKKLKFTIEHSKDKSKVEDAKKLLAKMSEKKDVKEWVNKLVESKVYPFTSKDDIMNLIHKKINEQTETMAPPTSKTSKIPEFLTYDQIVNSGAAEPMTAPPVTKPGTKPVTKPGTTPTKRPNPYQPGPGINPAPKAIKK